MAERRAVATGNWSSLATWDGGASLPAAGDTVHANGFTVTIDQDITVVSLNTIAGSVAAAGGTFQVPTGGRTITANCIAGSTSCLNCTHTSGTTTVNGNSQGSNGAVASLAGINFTGNGGSLVQNGNVTGGSGPTCYGTMYAGGANITVNGNIVGGSGGTAIGCRIMTVAGATLITNGTIQGAPTQSTSRGLYSDVLLASWTHQAGTITGNASQGVQLPSMATTFSVTADVVGGSNASTAGAGIEFGTGTGSGTITGTITGGNSANPGVGVIWGATAGTLTITGAVNGSRGSAISKASNGALIINGDVTGGGIASNTYALNETSTSGSTTINGNVYTNVATAIQISGTSCSLTVNGNVYNNSTLTGTYGIFASSGGPSVTVNGDVYANPSTTLANCPGMYSASTGTVIITGTVTAGGGATSHGLSINAAGSHRVGCAKANDYPNSGIVQPTPGVFCATALLGCTIDSMEFGSGGANPLSPLGRWLIRDAGTNFVKMRQSNGGTITIMGEVGADYPVEANVRYGTQYAFTTKTGTARIPAASSVAAGVLVDNTVGTALLTQQNIADAVGPLMAAWDA